MVLTKIQKYTIDLPGFENLEFTESSEDNLDISDAVKFAEREKSILQSLPEAAAFRIEADGKYDANRWQVTRSTPVYFKADGKIYVAVDHSPDSKKNIVLARAQEGYNVNKAGRECILDKKDKHIARILKEAEKNGNIAEIVNDELELSTQLKNGKSEFGQNKTAQMLLGNVSEPYAKWLKKQGYQNGFIYLANVSKLDNLLTANNTVVRSGGLCNDDCVVDANCNFSNYGRARGVRSNAKNSP